MSCCEDVGGVILFWQSTRDRRMKALIILMQKCLICSSPIRNTVFSHKFLWEIIKLEAKHKNIKVLFCLSFRVSSFFWENSPSFQYKNLHSVDTGRNENSV